MLLQQYPVLREDDAMRRAYMFLIDFLEAVGKETSSRMRQNQASLRIILEVSVIFELAFYFYFFYLFSLYDRQQKYLRQKSMKLSL